MDAPIANEKVEIVQMIGHRRTSCRSRYGHRRCVEKRGYNQSGNDRFHGECLLCYPSWRYKPIYAMQYHVLAITSKKNAREPSPFDPDGCYCAHCISIPTAARYRLALIGRA